MFLRVLPGPSRFAPEVFVLDSRRSAHRFALVTSLGALAAVSACRSATEPAERVYSLDIAPVRVPCVGAVPQECLQVREQPDAPYSLFYDTISGFAYEPGYRYLLQVGERTVAHPPADGSSKTYRLIAVLSKAPVSP